MQKSVGDLEKLCQERKGANFVVTSKSNGKEKVLIDPYAAIEFKIHFVL